MIQIKNAAELAKMRRACEISAAALKAGGAAIEPGISTAEIDKIIYDFIVRHGARPNFLHLYGFPATACISVNDTVIHGIPTRDQKIRPGDIVSIDTGCKIDGFNGDNACTFGCGKLDMEALLEGRDDPDEEYVNFLVEAVARAIELAKRDAFPAALGAQTAVCGAERGVGGNRREKGGICDPSVNVIAVRDEDKVIRGIFLSYALHPTFIHEDSDVVTADYPGSIRRCFAESHPQAVFGFAQGTSGDQSSRYFRTGQSYSEADRVGGEMYRAALEAIDSMTFDADPVLATACAEIPIELREYDPIPVLKDRAEQAVAAYEQLKAAGADYLSVQNANLRMLGAEDILGYATLMEHGTHIRLLHDENPAEVMAIRLGDACIACFPGEVFVEYGLRVKEVSPFRLTMVTELKGCLPGYCYTPEGERAGGYEVDTSMLARDFGEKMTALLSQQVRKVWER